MHVTRNRNFVIIHVQPSGEKKYQQAQKGRKKVVLIHDKLEIIEIEIEIKPQSNLYSNKLGFPLRSAPDMPYRGLSTRHDRSQILELRRSLVPLVPTLFEILNHLICLDLKRPFGLLNLKYAVPVALTLFFVGFSG